MSYQHTLTLGKVAWYGARRINCCTLDWSISPAGEFTMSANVWNNLGTDVIAVGQCVDEVVARFPHHAQARRMCAIWKKWHLNHMNAGTPAQTAELALHTFPGYPMSHLDWTRGVLAAAGLQPDTSHGTSYSYGSAWLKVELPPEVRAEIEAWRDDNSGE